MYDDLKLKKNPWPTMVDTKMFHRFLKVIVCLSVIEDKIYSWISFSVLNKEVFFRLSTG